jgi:hypothetical protein
MKIVCSLLEQKREQNKFLVVIGLRFRPQSFLTILANSAMNSVPWLRVIGCGSGHLVNNQVVSQTSGTSTAVLLSICSISNQPVTGGSIMVRHHSFRSSLPLR